MRPRKSCLRACVVAVLLTAGGACASRDPKAIKEDSVRRGDQFIEQKRYPQAAEAYRRALEADPADRQLRVKLSDTYSLGGDVISAADVLSQDAAVQVRLARVLLEQRRFADAADRLAPVIRADPENVIALVLQANATARLPNATWPLSALASVVDDPKKFDATRRDATLGVSPSENVAAEQTFRKALALGPSLAEAQLSFINFLWVTGRVDESEPLLRTVADVPPGNSVASYALAEYYLSRHQAANAEKYLRIAATSGDTGRSARFALVDYYLGLRREDAAKSVLDSMDVTDDASGGVSIRLAALDAQSGKPAEAVRRLDALLARTPGYAPALLLKAQLIFAKGNPDLRYARAAVAADPSSSDARLLLGQALGAAGDLSGASEQLAAAVRLNPTSPPAILALARVLLTLDRAPEALARAIDAVRLAPNDPDAALTLVKARILEPDYPAAEDTLKPLLSRWPDHPDVAVQTGRIQAAKGNDTAARVAFLRALQLDPDSPDALSGLVSLELKARPSAETQRRVEAAVAAHPRDAQLRLVAARLYMGMHAADRAETMLRQAFEGDPANVEVGRALADFLIGDRRPNEAIDVLRALVGQRPRALDVKTSLALLLEQVGREVDARPLYEQIVAEDPEAAMVSFRLANLYVADADKLSRAFDLIRSAKAGLPQDPAVNNLLGRIYLLKNLPRLAIPPLRDAVQISPNNALYRCQLGNAYEREGHFVEAGQEYTRALQIDGTFTGADHAREFLATHQPPLN